MGWREWRMVGGKEVKKVDRGKKMGGEGGEEVEEGGQRKGGDEEWRSKVRVIRGGRLG